MYTGLCVFGSTSGSQVLIMQYSDLACTMPLSSSVDAVVVAYPGNGVCFPLVNNDTATTLWGVASCSSNPVRASALLHVRTCLRVTLARCCGHLFPWLLWSSVSMVVVLQVMTTYSTSTCTGPPVAGKDQPGACAPGKSQGSSMMVCAPPPTAYAYAVSSYVASSLAL
jgi:hypothetical protein